MLIQHLCFFLELKKVQLFENLSLLNILNMSYLISIYMSNFESSKVTILKNLFARSTALVNINLLSLDTSNVTRKNDMFNGSSSWKILI